MLNTWVSYIAVTTLAVSAIGIFIWRQKKRNFIRVGKVAKLFFYPIKSLKAVEVTEGRCTKYGFEVNGLLDRYVTFSTYYQYSSLKDIFPSYFCKEEDSVN